MIYNVVIGTTGIEEYEVEAESIEEARECWWMEGRMTRSEVTGYGIESVSEGMEA